MVTPPQKQVTDRNVTPLEFMSFMADAPVRFEVKATTTKMIGDDEQETWHDAMYDLVDYLEERAVGRFWIGLGSEDLLTDDYCQLAVYLADPQDEAIVLQAYEKAVPAPEAPRVDHVGWMKDSLDRIVKGT